MKATSADTLEYESLRALLGRYVSSPPGKAELARIAPHTDAARLAADLADVGEAVEYLRSAARPQTAARGASIRIDFGGFPDLTEAVHKLRIEGASLEGKEIFDLFGVLDRAADAKSVLNAVAERFPRLGARAQSLGDFRALLKDLEGKIQPDGSVADHASVALARLRRDIERQRKSIQGSLERFLKSHQEEGVLQEEFVTIRNERFVVPIVAGQRRKIDGVIHAASASDHTLFVEPLETIGLNNELVRLAEEETQEVHRILRDARHPLLQDVLRRQRKPVVPISLELDERSKTLLISGPNTGGKTVSLKTVGLLTLMAQSGLPVPAAVAEFPIFGQVLADIGDNQSIQESLSTFSAHISHIREMALDVTPDSLVLLDELGAATDPEEGGALGVAIVEHFRAAGANRKGTRLKSS